MKTSLNSILSFCPFFLLVVFDLPACQPGKSTGSSLATPAHVQDTTRKKIVFINTSFENASQLDWEVDSSGVVNISLIYDHERSSPNRANGHWHFQIEAPPGADLTLTLKNFDNVWNGMKASPVSDKTNCFISKDGVHWVPEHRMEDGRRRVACQQGS